MKQFIRKLVPGPVISVYHLVLAIVANVIFGFPSKELTVIGVTGTNGKTTTCNLIAEILEKSGKKIGLTTSINFKIDEKEWVNKTKQGMQGRFKLQKLLRQMVKAGCTHAVIETTSEGIKQYRHWGIGYDVAVFTNLTPEHIEAHGSFQQYKEAKGKLFAALKGKGVSIVNKDDEHAEYFEQFPAKEKLVYRIANLESRIPSRKKTKEILVTEYTLTNQGAEFTVLLEGKEYTFKTKLLGLFNIYNSLAATSTCVALGVDMVDIQKVLTEINPVPGRMEIIHDEKRDITVVVDYAHDPAALEQVYKTLLEIRDSQFEIRLIAVLGAVGGGRDHAKRPKLGALASEYAKYVIITNEDPYDDDPEEIMNEVEKGVQEDQKREINTNYWKILDRREAIKKSLELAEKGDIIALTGKGAEEVMAVKGGCIEWDDRKVVRDILYSS